MKLLFLYLILFSSTAFAQQVSISEIKLRPKPKFYNTREKTITYPVISTGNRRADALINAQIKEECLSPETENQSLTDALKNKLNEGLTILSWEVTLKSKGILSINIFMEVCTAHLNSWTTYFNFDLKTGKSIRISDLVTAGKTDSLKAIVLRDKLKGIAASKTEILDNLHNGDIDSSTYHWALEQIDDNCTKEASLDQFSLSASSITISDPCELSYAIRALQPGYELKYTFKSIAAFLNPRFRKLFCK